MAPLVVSLVLVAVSGCGEDDPTEKHGNAEAAEPTVTPPPDRLSLLAAQQAVQHYYRAIDNYNYSTAWAALGREPRVEFEGFTTWKAGHDSTLETNLARATASRLGPRSASVRVTLNTLDLDDCGNEVPQTFSGTWVVESVGGIATLTGPDIEKVAGDDPTASCAPSAPPPQPAAPEPASSDCHPSYEGACLDPTSSDYDCAGGSGNGPDYVDGPIYVVGDDEYGLDADYDGEACE